MKAILAPTDFSPNAALAVDYAAKLAQKAGARLLLVHGCTLLDDRYASYKELIREANEAQVKTLTEKLNEIRDQVVSQWQIEASIHLYKTENITDCILQLGDEQADLIVLGTYGKTGMRRKLFGSKAAEVINHSKKPVLTIPPAFSRPQQEKILMAVEAAERNTQPFRFVHDLATLLHGKVYLASYTQDDADAYEFVTSSHQLQELGSRTSAIFPEAPPEIVRLSGNDFQEAIGRYIEEEAISMLAMITRERSFWQNIFDSSLTQQMSYVAKVPLLSLRRS